MSSWTKVRLPLLFAHGFQVQGDAPLQEDYFEINPERGIFLLADGFGGGAGREAAEKAVKAVRYFLEQEAGDLDATLPFELRPYYSLGGNVLFNAIAYANQELLKINLRKSWMDIGGASVLAGFLEGKLLALASVGANRLHLKRGDRFKEVVSPKNLLTQVNPMESEGPGDEIPLMSLGTTKSLEPEIIEIELREGDQLFFQTSGVKHNFRDQVSSLASPTQLSHVIDSFPSKSNASFVWLGF